MRTRKFAVLIAAAAALVALGLVGPAGAGQENTFTVEKVVEGPVPDGAVFEVVIDCTSIVHVADGADAAPSAVFEPVTVRFDATGAPIDSNSVMIGSGYECKAEEAVTNGATVTYACATGEVHDGDAALPDSALAMCTDDQTVSFDDAFGTTGTITVTNTFEEEPEPETAPAAAAPAGVVAATPTFTG